ncbi:uncharacterized protein CDAR_369821 [Caerostris darwini]|uniref:Autophagy-related protein 27 n=1 Tax=Caerostris darwini TaxID=1538125 RepID=A0AAV4Q0E6_9ARAC|nr:uncharacterized protein CDAR_369821 [Caerostris darwini]
MFLKICILFLFVIQINVSATLICTSQDPCKCVLGPGHVIDLHTVGSPDRPRFYEITNSNITGFYSYNPCFAFNSEDKFATVSKGNIPCKNAAACLRTPGSESGEPPEEHAIGIQSTAQFQASVDGTMEIFYKAPGARQNLTVILQCDNTTLYHLSINQPETSENGSVVMTLSTKCACEKNSCSAPTPDENPSHGLSVGSKLLIAFFTIFLAYFIIGMVWNFCNGAHGTELVPNIDFWNELPKLTIEGVAFTCSCFGRKRSYGEV